MAITKEKKFNHSGLLFLIFIFLFIIVINCIPLFLKKQQPIIKLDGEKEVYIESKLPITDVSAKELNVNSIQKGIIGYSEFTISMDDEYDESINYEIYLTDVTGNETFKYDYIKVYLTDENEKAYSFYNKNQTPSYRDLRVSLNEPDKRILYSGKISTGSKQKFRLRIWLTDTYVLSSDRKEFKGEISIKAVSKEEK